MGFRWVKVILFAVFCLSVSLIAASLFLRNPPSDNISAKARQGSSIADTDADVTLQSIRLVENRGGRTEWELYAEESQTFKDKNITILRGVSAVFYPEGQPIIRIKGKQGRLRTDTRDMVLQGDVVVQSGSGYTLKTQELKYSSRDRLVNTEKPVELVQEGLTVRGVGLSAAIDEKTIIVHRDVRATFK